MLSERFRELRAALGDEDEWVSVYCSGCGRIEDAYGLAHLLPKVKGWQINETFGGNDLCPKCRDEGAGWAGSFPKRREERTG